MDTAGHALLLDTRVAKTPQRKPLCLVSAAGQTPTFYREYFATLMTFPSHPSFRGLSSCPLFLYTKGYAPSFPLSYLDTGVLFYTGDRKSVV